MHKGRKADVNDNDINFITNRHTHTPITTQSGTLKPDKRMQNDNIVIEDAKNGKGSVIRAMACAGEQFDVAVLAVTSREDISRIAVMVFVLGRGTLTMTATRPSGSWTSRHIKQQ